MPGSDGRQESLWQEGRMNENRDVTNFLVSRLNQALGDCHNSTTVTDNVIEQMEDY